MRTLAVDLGGKRVGLAMSDDGGRFATPYDVLEVRSPEHAAELIRSIVHREQVRRLAIGVPLNMDGSAGAAARAAVDWGRRLGASTGQPVVFLDERLSSFDAEQLLLERRKSGEKLTRGQRKKQLDAQAAAGFLQAFLDGRLQPLNLE